jgi:hypothetical protein
VNNYLYVGDAGSFRIQKVDLTSTPVTVTTFLENIYTAADVVVQTIETQQTMYCVDTIKHRVLAINMVSKERVVVNEHEFEAPRGMALASSRMSGSQVWKDEGDLYVSDIGNHRVWRVTKLPLAESGGLAQAWEVVPIAGSGEYGYSDGLGTAATFKHPYGLAYNQDNSVTPPKITLYVADFWVRAIRKIDLTTVPAVAGEAGTGVPTYAVTTVAGTLGAFANPYGVAVHSGNKFLYVVDNTRHQIKRIEDKTP